MTFLPRSKTMGFSPNSIKRSAAKSPAGPDPTIMIGVADATF